MPEPAPLRRVARVQVSPELLAYALSFPSGTQVLGCYRNQETGKIEILVEHPFLKEYIPGTGVPTTEPVYNSGPGSAEDVWMVHWGVQHDELAERSSSEEL